MRANLACKGDLLRICNQAPNLFLGESGEEPQIDHQQTITGHVLNNYQSFT